jgi:hypothetical protein
MAQPGFTPIVLYHSTTPSNVPSAANLRVGELAVNIADRKIFTKDASGNVVEIVGPSSGGGSGGGTGGASSGDMSGAVAFTGVLTPAQITADTNDYAPTGLYTASTLRLSTDATRNLTGLAGGTNGRLMIIHNVGSNPLVLKNESSDSAPENRFLLGGSDLTLNAGQSCVLQYDSTNNIWRSITGVFSSVNNSEGYRLFNVVIITEVGDGVYSVPNNVTALLIRVVGGGGGGGGGYIGTNNSIGGGGGGAGGYCEIFCTGPFPEGCQFMYYIGAGGIGGQVGNDSVTGGDGGIGGATYFFNLDIFQVVSLGGGGGYAGNSYHVGCGGVGLFSEFNISRHSNYTGTCVAVTSKGCTGGNAFLFNGGAGGASALGGGGYGGSFSENINFNLRNGTCGGGGGGGSGDVVGGNGGNGGSGYIEIYEFVGPVSGAGGNPQPYPIGLIVVGNSNCINIDSDFNEVSSNDVATLINSHPTYTGITTQIIDGQYMVRIPKFYFKAGTVPSGTYAGKAYWMISDQPVSGFTVHPAFLGAGGVELDQIWIGKYQASYDGTSSKAQSIPGVMPMVSVDFPTARARAYARNTGGVTGFRLWSIYDLCAIQMLATIEMGGLDMQSLIGQGRVNASSAANVDASDVAQATWRGIVGLWGNVSQMTDGIKTLSGKWHRWQYNMPENITTDDFSTGYVNTYKSVVNGGTRPATFNTDLLTDGVIAAATVTNIASNGLTGDFWYSYSDSSNRLWHHGGSWNDGSDAGMFCAIVSDTPSSTASYIGTRLAKV